MQETRILIIDDEEVVLDSCKMVLGPAGYKLTTASNGTAGLGLVRELQPDLIFVDLKMPGISGFEFLERLRAMDPNQVAIVITGYATVNSAVEAMKKGAYDFLPKPFTPDELRLITKRGLEKHRLLQEAIVLRREKEMLRENFAAIVSHELKSPLSALQQNLFGLTAELEDKLGDEQKARLERMKGRLDDLLKLIHTWLRVFSVDVNKIKEQFQPVAVASVITRAIENVLPHTTRKNIELTSDVREPLPPVMGDAVSLIEVLGNILNNAVKYSHPQTKIQLTAAAEVGAVVITVRDNGIGIAKEDLPRVFGDFYRGKGAPQMESGCGMGLAISRRIVEAHGGSIAVESEPGKGSQFTVRLPAKT
ncbi:MAG: hybrid sensor histidine kinase/response regulator [Verrucomicrobia bacterium]|nr:hybrid sensor histidine kinase/response regulator [Verrucomicrobiota bacterium]